MAHHHAGRRGYHLCCAHGPGSIAVPAMLSLVPSGARPDTVHRRNFRHSIMLVLTATLSPASPAGALQPPQRAAPGGVRAGDLGLRVDDHGGPVRERKPVG